MSALRVKCHHWACLSGTKMCVRQKRAVVCQSGGSVDTASKRSGPFDASRRVRVVDAGVGGVVRVSCQCESALFPALDAWSVLPVTADLPVFTLSLHSSSSSLQCASVIMRSSVVLVVFFFPLLFSRAFDIRRSCSFPLSLHIGLGGAPSSQSDRGAPPRSHAASCRFQFAAATHHGKRKRPRHV